ncbi:hypothetical protein Tco_1150748, partial [Tanacetum coccineum]
LSKGLVFREEVIDNDFSKLGVRQVFMSAFLQLPVVDLECKPVIAYSFASETLVDNSSQSSPSVPKRLHKDFKEFSRDGKCLLAGRFLDNIDDNLKSFFLLWNSSLQSYIGGTDLDSFLSGNLLFITSSNMTNFFLIHDSV